MLDALSFTDTPASLSITVPPKAQVSFLAKPCWESLAWSGCDGAPKHGKTTGMPPRTGLVPSKAALEDTNKRSFVSVAAFEADLHEMTDAPYRRISTEEPYIVTC